MWQVVSGSDRRALDVVDGVGRFAAYGPHYSRRTPGARTFVGCGRDLVLLSEDGAAVWAVVHQRTPAARGTGGSRGRVGEPDERVRMVFRNMLFRRLPECRFLASDLIREATEVTYLEWLAKYDCVPAERLRTEVDVRRTQSKNPGYCYVAAGWERGELRRGKRLFWAPDTVAAEAAE